MSRYALIVRTPGIDRIKFYICEGCSDAEILAYVGGFCWEVAQIRDLLREMGER